MDGMALCSDAFYFVECGQTPGRNVYFFPPLLCSISEKRDLELITLVFVPGTGDSSQTEAGCRQAAGVAASGRRKAATDHGMVAVYGLSLGCVRRSAPAGASSLLVGDAWREQSEVAGPGKHLGKQVARGTA